MKRRNLRGAVVLLAAGCAEAILPPPSTSDHILVDPGPSGSEQAAIVGNGLPSPLRVRVERAGVGVAGVVVHWATSGDGGTLAPISSVTDANGIAATDWTMPFRSGPKVAMAFLDDRNVPPVVFRARAEPTAPHRMLVVEGDGQVGVAGMELALPVRVRVVDPHDNPVPGQGTIWDVVLGDGSVSPLAVATDGGGIAAAKWTLGEAETQRLRVRLAGDGVNDVAVHATALTVGDQPTVVAVGNHFFRDAHVRIPRGSVVVWEWDDTGAIPHSVRSGEGGGFPSSPVLLGLGARHAVRFTVPGTYDYDCAIHGNLMSGRITVE